MSFHREFASKQAGKPLWLGMAFLGFSLSFYGFYSYAYKPWQRRKRHTVAEDFANYIFEKEKELNNTESERFDD